MAKHLQKGKCVYCLKDSENLTWDHVFPKSWYPDSTPTQLEKWKVPSCRDCNFRLGKIEEDLLTRLGLCIYPVEFRSLGIPTRVLRSLNPVQGRNEEDGRNRKRKKERIIQEIKPLDSASINNTFPNFGLIPGIKYDEIMGITIDPENLKQLTFKIIKGITYINKGLYITDDYQIEMYISEDEKIQSEVDFINTRGKMYDRGPGFVVKCAIVGGEKFIGLYAIEIWGKLKIYASVKLKI